MAVEVVTQYEKYLGMSSFVGRTKKETFSYIRESVAQNPRLERKTPITSGPGDPNQSSHPSNADLHYRVFQTPQKFV